MVKPFISLVLAAILLLGACDGNPPPDEPPPTGATGSPSISGEIGDCLRADILEAGEQLGGQLRGDVTADGSDDVIYVVRRDGNSIECRDFLVVEAEDATYLAALAERGREYGLAEPRINSLATIDAEPGAEILVDLEQGASTQFVGMFTMHEADMVRVRFQGEDAPPDLFPYGGSVGHIEASDCGEEPGTVVVSVAIPLRDRYEVERSVYRFEGAELVPDQGASERVVVAPDEIQELPEFRSSPFGSCPSP